jgi:hypothetical protein
MPGVGIDSFGAAFDHNLPGVVKILERTSKLRKIPLGKLKWQGNKVVKTLHIQYNTSWTSTVDGGPIIPASKQGYVKMEASRRFHGGSVQITDGELENAKTSKNVAIRVVDSELRNLLELAKRYENFMFSRDGTGIISKLGDTVSGTTIKVTDARMMLRGLEFEIRDASTPTTIHATGKVKSVSRAPDTNGYFSVTLESSIAASGQAEGDLIVWQTGDYSAYGRAIHGTGCLIDDSTSSFQGVDCSLYPQWTSPVLDGGGSTQTLTPSLFRQMQATLKQESSDDSVPGGMLVYTSVWDGVTVEELFEHLLRLTPDAKSVGMSGGMIFKSALGQFTVMSDHDMPYGEMHFIDRKQLSYLKQRELGWRKTGRDSGSIFLRNDRNYSYTANALEIGDLMIEERNSCGKITNLDVSPQSAY